MVTNLFKNQLQELLTNPSSFTGTPGYNFTRDAALQATQRSNSSSRNSGNALAALADRGASLASTEYGNTVDRLGKLSGQEDSFNLGSEQNANNAQRNAWDFQLGTNKNANDFSLGNDRNANDATRNANDYTLGVGKLGNDAQNNWYGYDLGRGQNANVTARNANDFNIANGRNGIDWFNAGTNRGSSQSTGWLNNSRNNLDWAKYQNPNPWAAG